MMMKMKNMIMMTMTRWQLEVAVEAKTGPSVNRDPVSSFKPAAGIVIIIIKIVIIFIINIITMMKEMMMTMLTKGGNSLQPPQAQGRWMKIKKIVLIIFVFYFHYFFYFSFPLVFI